MITVVMAEPEPRELDLQFKAEDFRGAALANEARSNLPGRLSLGGPVHRRITPQSADDRELRHFLEQEAHDSDFFLVHLTCTLRPSQDEPFTEVLIELDLKAADEHSRPPIAWSMLPDRLFDTVEISRSVSLGPSLKFQGFSLDAKAASETKRESKEVFLDALNELQSTPAWELFRTESTPLQGLQRFHLVIRAAKGSTTLGRAIAEAKVNRKRFGILPYSAALPGSAEPITFQIE